MFWTLLRGVAGLDPDIRALLADARAVLRRRSVLPLMVRCFLVVLDPAWRPSPHGRIELKRHLGPGPGSDRMWFLIPSRLSRTWRGRAS